MDRTLPLDADARAALRAMADGDGRYLLNLAEQLSHCRQDAAARHRRALPQLLQKRAAALRQGPRGALQPDLRPA